MTPAPARRRMRSPHRALASVRRVAPPLALGLVLGVAAATLAGCAVGPNYQAPRIATPDHYDAAPTAPTAPTAAAAAAASAAPVAPAASPAAARASVSAVDLSRWWGAFGDPELDALVSRAVQSNPDVEIALDRLQEARTYEAGLVGTVLPVAEASGGAGRGTGSDLGRGRASQSLVSATTAPGLSQINALGGFDAAWELDLFGKFRREIEAARYDAQAAAAARNAVLVSVIADVAAAYVDLRGLQVRAAVLHRAIGTLRESLRIVTIRYQRGITNELDVTLATRELDTLLAQVAPVDAQVQAAEYTLATLLGDYPEQVVRELSSAGMIPSVPATVAAGLPLDLLRRRPDIIEAERQLASANARIGVATASLFPELAVTGSIGAEQGFGSSAVIGQHIWSAGPAAAWPLLDFGQLDARVQIADLDTRARLVRYKHTIQEAVREVDTALAGLGAQQASLAALGDALVASQRAVTLATERYNRGLTDFLNVVDAEREEYTIEEQYAGTQVSVDTEFIALYRALGGGWQRYQKLPPLRRPLPAVIAIFRETLDGDHPLKNP